MQTISFKAEDVAIAVDEKEPLITKKGDSVAIDMVRVGLSPKAGLIPKVGLACPKGWVHSKGWPCAKGWAGPNAWSCPDN